MYERETEQNKMREHYFWRKLLLYRIKYIVWRETLDERRHFMHFKCWLLIEKRHENDNDKNKNKKNDNHIFFSPKIDSNAN